MSNANELIRQIIRKQRLHTIYPGQEESAFGDLLQTAWVQIERTLYKYRSRPHCRACYNPDNPGKSLLYYPKDTEYGIKSMEEIIRINKQQCPHCNSKLSNIPIIEPVQDLYGGSASILYRGTSKVFNMWSQIARTVILAYIKKEGRDKKNSQSYTTHLDNKSKPIPDMAIRFIQEARDLFQHNYDYITIINALDWLMHHDDRPHDGMIGKLVEKTKLSRATVTGFMRIVKLRSHEFTDSPINRNAPELKNRGGDSDEEDYD